MNESPQYDEFADKYTTYTPTDTDLVHNWMEQELGDDLAEKILVDAGVGTGRWFPTFKALGAEQVIGIDQSRGMLESIPHHGEIVNVQGIELQTILSTRRNIILVHGELEKILPTIPDSVDIVFASYSLCVMDNPMEAIDAMHIALKLGGIGLISTNVFVERSDAPTESDPMKEVLWNESAVSTMRVDGNGHKDLRLILRLSDEDLVLRDKAHSLSDYVVSSEKFSVEKASLVYPQDVTFIDGKDAEPNNTYFNGTDPNVISVQDTTLQMVQLCLKLRKVI